MEPPRCVIHIPFKDERRLSTRWETGYESILKALQNTHHFGKFWWERQSDPIKKDHERKKSYEYYH